ncbi:MAG: hypothetical protein MAG453_01875 [Calditrichaeota bacterium]|nr:hypothetical protein [Calditrichota bacterium]
MRGASWLILLLLLPAFALGQVEFEQSVVADAFVFDPGEWPAGGSFLAAGERESALSPEEAGLLSVHPNPFNARTAVTVRLPETSELTVTVHNVMGREVARASPHGRYTGAASVPV